MPRNDKSRRAIHFPRTDRRYNAALPHAWRLVWIFVLGTKWTFHVRSAISRCRRLVGCVCSLYQVSGEMTVITIIYCVKIYLIWSQIAHKALVLHSPAPTIHKVTTFLRIQRDWTPILTSSLTLFPGFCRISEPSTPVLYSVVDSFRYNLEYWHRIRWRSRNVGIVVNDNFEVDDWLMSVCTMFLMISKWTPKVNTKTEFKGFAKFFRAPNNTLANRKCLLWKR